MLIIYQIHRLYSHFKWYSFWGAFRYTSKYIRNHCIVQLGLEAKNKDLEGQKTLRINEKEENETISNDANAVSSNTVSPVLKKSQ